MNNKSLLLLLFVLGFTSWSLLESYKNAFWTPLTLVKPVTIEIKKGESLNQVSKKLHDMNIGISRIWFTIIAQSEQAAKKLKPGVYELNSGLTLPQILDLFVQGKARQFSITFPEGRNFREILQEIDKNPNLQKTLSNGQENVDIKQRVVAFLCDKRTEGKDAVPVAILCPLSTGLEGVFFPDTYFFEKNTTDLAILKRAFNKMQSVLQQEWQNRAQYLAVQTPYQALILASIIEKETAASAERPLISGVFTRRLQTGMLLQTDPTVIYGMGENYHGNISSENLITATPYNTYKIKGLPPTPIAMPGREAIFAALHPDTSNNSIYFVARGDGTHQFSATLDEHNRAVNTWQRKKK